MSSRAIGKVIASAVAVLGAAGLTLACMFAIVAGTTRALGFESLPLRVLAVAADFVIGSVLLIGCIYLVTRLAGLILGVGHSEFPSFPANDSSPRDSGKI
jgi:hypothetical protein